MWAATVKKRKGFTLIEILAVISILAVLFAIISSPIMSFYRKVVFQGATENVLTMLDEARKSTLSSYYSSQYGVHVTSSTITLFKGNSYSAVDPNNDVYELSSAVEITEINLTGGGNDVVFERITGETTQDGTIVLTPRIGDFSSSTITVHKSGLVEINN